jgi:hypothetical protein
VEEADFVRLTPGRIITACVLDMQGGNPKVRPLVILTKPSSNDLESQIQVVCGSRTPPIQANEPFTIRLPGGISPNRNPKTGLRDTTWFYAGWVRTIKVGEVVDFLKFFPGYELTKLGELITQAANANLPNQENA